MSEITLSGNDVQCPEHEASMEMYGYEQGIGSMAILLRCRRPFGRGEDGAEVLHRVHNMRLVFSNPDGQARAEVEAIGEEYDELPTQGYPLLDAAINPPPPEAPTPIPGEAGEEELAEEMEASEK